VVAMQNRRRARRLAREQIQCKIRLKVLETLLQKLEAEASLATHLIRCKVGVFHQLLLNQLSRAEPDLQGDMEERTTTTLPIT
jgi:hypothetical protein